jgi:protein-disulfide isomerase
MPSLRSILIACAAAATGFLSLQASAAEFSPAQTSEIETIVKDYLVKNPEILRDAMAALERKQKDEEVATREKVVSDNATILFNSANQANVGNAKGKITIVEFFDYNCGYCKRTVDDMAKLMKNEPDLRVVLKDFPVLGPGSVEAAKIASAVRNQFKGDKFWEYHQRLFSMPHPREGVGKAQALAVAKELGADMDRLEKDADAPDTKKGIEETMQLADSLSLNGTPSFVVGSDVVVGAVGYDELKSKIDNVRKCGKAVCS